MKNFFMIATNQVIQVANKPDGVVEKSPCSELIFSVLEPEYIFMVPQKENGFEIGKSISSETYRFLCTADDIKNIIERLKKELEALENLK